MARILIVDDEPSMRIGLKDNLEFEGYEVEAASDGEEGLSKILSNNYDLIVLDVMMPKMSGFDVCKKVREAKNEVPIILLTAKGEEIDKVLGLEIGADDYITKPFGLRELLARIKAILRRTIKQDDNEKLINIGKMEFDFEKYSAFENNKPVQLSFKEFEVLHYLWENKNSTVSRNELLKNVWDQNSFITSRSVDNFILRLRKKVEKDANNPQIILTVHGIGYKMIQ